MNSINFWGHMLGMGKRLITEKQEQALRLCHHDFEGLSHEEAAARMGVTRQAIEKHLACCEKVMPHMFPILSKQEATCYHYLTVEGWSPREIATCLGISINAVYKTFLRCKEKGLPFPEPHGRVLEYAAEMDDNQIKEKF